MKLNALGLAVATASLTLSTGVLAGTVTTNGSDLVIDTKGGLKVSTTDKKYVFQVGGRIQYDYDQTEVDSDTVTDEFDVRRARIYVKGKVAEDWAFKAQFNVGNGGEDDEGGTPEDLYVRYTGYGKKAVITAGRQKMPFGLEELTSSKDISMLERSAITEAYAIGREDGVQLSGAQGDITYAFAFYEGEGSADSGSDDFSFAGRATIAPVIDDDTVVHFGAAYKNEGDGVEGLGLEAAAVFGPAHVQAEFVDGDSDDTGDVDGYYIQAGYVITGEQRPYKGGKFKRIKPTGENGALEVVARYENGEGKYSDIGLDTEDGSAWGVGLNWYVNNAVKLGVSYMDGESDDSNADGEELRGRIQLVF